MKKIIGILALMLLLTVSFVAAKPVTKVSYVESYDLNNDGIYESVVVVKESTKVVKKSTTVSLSYFTEDYLEYLGQEVYVNGEVVVDTFIYND